MAWHCKRPNIAYSENKLFDKYFEQLFRSDYPPADILALNRWAQNVEARWKGNSLGLEDALVATPSLSKFHLLFAVQACFCAASNQMDKVPNPSATVNVLDHLDPILTMAANCFNGALNVAINEYQERGRTFSPQNWLKAKDSVLKVQAAAKMFVDMTGMMTGVTDLRESLMISPDRFSLRWAAD